MKQTSGAACPGCGRPSDPEALMCSLCGHIHRRETAERLNQVRRELPSPFPVASRAVRLDHGPILGVPRSAFHLILGMPLALLLTRGPILSFAGWFLAALVHELGHALAAWFMGCPAIPAVGITGHAAAVHFDQRLLLAFVVWSMLGVAAVGFRKDRPALALLACATLVYPLMAFTRAKEVVHLISGHLGELVFATAFFYRSLAGGFSHKEIERPLYAMLGWFWAGGNFLLFSSLVLSEASRRWYLSNGSFGLENDFVRLADLLGWSLAAAAAPMIVLSLLPLPIAFAFYRLRMRGADESFG